jgi:hypothetical protein
MADATAHELLQRAKDHIAARRAAVHILKKMIFFKKKKIFSAPRGVTHFEKSSIHSVDKVNILI